MSKEDFECHITRRGDKQIVRGIIEDRTIDWKFFPIEGDSLLGTGVFCYATKYSNASLDRLNVNLATKTVAQHPSSMESRSSDKRWNSWSITP